MQNKGLIRLFAVLFGIVSIYQLSFTFISSKLESDAKDHARAMVADTEDDYLTEREALCKRFYNELVSSLNQIDCRTMTAVFYDLCGASMALGDAMSSVQRAYSESTARGTPGPGGRSPSTGRTTAT